MILRALVAALSLSAVDGGVATPPAKTDSAPKQAAPMSPDVKQLVDRVQAFYEKTQNFSADFTQAYTYKLFKRTQVSSGKVIFLKPALMRWEYEKPTAKTFVLAKDRVFMHDPEAKLLTRAAIDTNQLSASVTFLFGIGKLDKEFSIAKKACAKCTGTQLELTPLVSDPRFKRILLEVDEKTAAVLKSTVIDPDGSENAITFSGLTTNVGVGTDAGITEAHFKLSPPPGTQIQDFLNNAPVAADGGL